MSKLVMANVMRLKKNICFWIGFVFMFAAGICFPVQRYVEVCHTGTAHPIDNGFFACSLFVGIIMAAFCSLFTGTGYSDGTIRNKVFIGHKRTDIYLADMITSSVVGVVMCIGFFVPYLCIGIPLLGYFTIESKTVALIGVTVLVLAVAFASIFTLTAMICQNKAVVAVVCLLLAFGLLLTASYLNSRLQAPQTIPVYTMNEKNEPIASEEPNPRYLEGAERAFVQTIYDVLPGGQAIQCTSLEVVHLPRLPLYSILIMILTTGIGLFCFQKKDLK